LILFWGFLVAFPPVPFHNPDYPLICCLSLPRNFDESDSYFEERP
jgi:hypothetical protein